MGPTVGKHSTVHIKTKTGMGYPNPPFRYDTFRPWILLPVMVIIVCFQTLQYRSRTMSQRHRHR
jgi:hypothetical protein